ncbi:SAM-dependent methyltransferase [Haloferula sp. A504]|uniref:SAM-dependent methyltransferase n=1 Tax=Haloferula sp. A504 TaxID=3373601 RepID=UPI0031BE2118|nr:SAM-dependent methyltransferase [Verrucomicrobiaceae bacterium E54]
MASALHDPERGYYARRIREVGRRGDFSTAATLAPALGLAVSRWAADALAATGCRDLIELGPGGGVLAAAVQSNLPLRRRWRTRIHLVEQSEPLREQQLQRLGARFRWHTTLVEALAACRGRACIFSNEFFDAFPVRRFRRTSSEWEESWVLPGEETWRPITSPPDSSVFGQDFPEGRIVEVHESVRDWMTSSLSHWHRGRMLTIDYGSEIGSLYHRRPAGTLRGYLHHQRVEGRECFLRPGRQDLTTDINFTDLVNWSAPWSETRRLVSQAEFLADSIDPHDAGDRAVADPTGAGGSFLVWEAERRP